MVFSDWWGKLVFEVRESVFDGEKEDHVLIRCCSDLDLFPIDSVCGV